MSDDIVTRLREACVNFGDDYHNEAADEIERLRAEIKFWRTTAEKSMANTDLAITLLEMRKAAVHD